MNIQVGGAVQHPIFGLGVVKESISGKLRLQFSSGIKTVLAGYVVPAEHTDETRRMLLPPKKAKTRTPCALPPITFTDSSFAGWVKYLRDTGTYSLYVQARNDAGIHKARAEYQEWSHSDLSDDYIRVHEITQCSEREWFLTFYYEDGIPSPFPLVRIGNGGGKGAPCGLVSGKMIFVLYPVIVEQAVRLGLVARKRSEE